MAFKKRPSLGLSFGKQLTGYMFISIVFVALQLQPTSYSAAQSMVDEDVDDNQTNQISSIESIIPADNTTIINSTTPVSPNQMSPISSSSSPESRNTTPPSTTTDTTTTTEATTTTTSTPLPPPLPTPLPSKGYPKLSGSSEVSHLADNLLQSKAPYIYRTKRMKRSGPSMKKDASSGNSFSLIKYLLSNHLTPPNDYPMSYTLANTKSGQFGPVHSSSGKGNPMDSLDINDFSLGSNMMMNKIHSHLNPGQSVSFYPLTSSDIEAIELTGEGGDDTFNDDDGWNNQGTIDLISRLETDDNSNNNNIDLYSVDPFIPLRSFRSVPARSQSAGLLMKPILAMKRKRIQISPYAVERSPNPMISRSSLFGGDSNRYKSRSNTYQYEQLINRINDNPIAYL